MYFLTQEAPVGVTRTVVASLRLRERKVTGHLDASAQHSPTLNKISSIGRRRDTVAHFPLPLLAWGFVFQKFKGKTKPSVSYWRTQRELPPQRPVTREALILKIRSRLSFACST